MVDIDQINDDIDHPLNHQSSFTRRTSPWEEDDWKDLHQFHIELDDIEEMYRWYVEYVNPKGRYWDLICRITYRGEKYFLAMYAIDVEYNSNSVFEDFDDECRSYMLVTKFPDFFLNSMLRSDQKPDRIYRLMLQDGIGVQKPNPVHKINPKDWKNVPRLKDLCHSVIFENKDDLYHYKEQLPHILAESVADFIKVKDWEDEVMTEIFSKCKF